MEQAIRRGRLVGAVAGLLVAIPLAVSPVSAATSERILLQFPDLIVEMGCGYEIDITFPKQRQYLNVITDATGEPIRLLITGQLIIQFTNPATGESITQSIAGPEIIDPLAGTDMGTGRWAFPGGAEVFSGRTDFVGATFEGHVTELCDDLAT